MSHRTQITLTDSQYAHLREESSRTGIGLAELVRRALAATYGDVSVAETREAFDASFGAWRDRLLNGESYVEDLRHRRPPDLGG